ncbi:MAG: DPP IV N-terminal domain-containing protein [Ignavibacteriales bacterium]|nr:DPP IV N-terminal domain-containing protein [Ignavibacteriales bacterium]
MKLKNISLNILCVILFIIFCSNVNGQDKYLTFNQVFKSGEPKLLGNLPRILKWIDSDNYLEMRTEDGATKYIKVNANDGSEEIFLDINLVNTKLLNGMSILKYETRTDDYDKYLLKNQGKYYFFSIQEGDLKELLINDEIKNPEFSPDANYLAYTKEMNLFVYNLNQDVEKQFTYDGGNEILNGYASWVYYEEILGRSSQYQAYWWSPDSRRIVFLRFDDSPIPKFPLYNADGTHGELEWAHYPKPGDPNPFIKVGVIDISKSDIVWADFEEEADQYVAFPFWNNDCTQLFVQWMNRGQDTIKIFNIDLTKGNKEEIFSEYQPSWVEFFEDIYILKNGNGFILKSNVDGWNNLYHYNYDGKLINKITDSNINVLNINLVDEENNNIFFSGWMDNSTEQHLFSINFDGSELKQITKESGFHNCQVSPEGKYIIDTYSNINKPHKMDLINSQGEYVKNFGDRKLQILDEYKLGKTELFTIPTSDGFNLPALWYLPHDFDLNKKYPVIIEIYGGPASQSVRNSWSYSLSSHYLAQNGIIVLVVDHRGSSHFDKKTISLMHRNLGKWEMNDYIETVKWLKQKSFIDTTKIGITGGSYGGYVTCMALTYGADYFTHGIAEFSVTDWHLYDNVYTERYMDTPEENPDGYNFGSVMNYVDKYKGKLLITHGTLDDNVHMQNSIQLISKLQDLDKDFEMMFYPNERHGLRYPKRNHSNRESIQFWFKYFLDKELNINE